MAENEKRGFRGLGDMVSNVDEDLGVKESPEEGADDEREEVGQSQSDASPTVEDVGAEEASEPPVVRPKNKSGKVLLWIVAGIVLLFVLPAIMGKKPGKENSSSSSTSTQEQEAKSARDEMDRQAYQQNVASLAPGWQEIIKEEGFASYLKNVDSRSGRSFYDLFEDANNRRDAKLVGWFFNNYKEIQRAAQNDARARQLALQSRNDESASKERSVAAAVAREVQAKSSQEKYLRSLNALVPDWTEIKNDPGFSDFLSSTDSRTKRTFLDLAREAEQRYDANLVSWFYKTYKEKKSNVSGINKQSEGAIRTSRPIYSFTPDELRRVSLELRLDSEDPCTIEGFILNNSDHFINDLSIMISLYGNSKSLLGYLGIPILTKSYDGLVLSTGEKYHFRKILKDSCSGVKEYAAKIESASGE